MRASEEEIARSLEGNWQEDLLFVLKQEQDGYEFCQKQMAECDRQLNHYLGQREDRSHGAPLPEEKRKGRRKKKSGNKPQFDLRTGLFRMTGTDLTRIDSIDVMTATTILSEAGWDMSKWETEDHFVSWLRLCPDNRISGNKVIGKGRLPTNNRVTIALKMAASTLRQSDTYLGAQFRRFRTRLGAPVAIKAMAAKLARLVYRMLRYGMKYVDKGAAIYQDAAPAITDQATQVESRHPRIPTHREFQRPNNHEFLGRSITILERRVNRQRSGRSRGAQCSGIRRKCWQNWWES